jgi:formylglycine-generating enzyme required for sulfatase activity
MGDAGRTWPLFLCYRRSDSLQEATNLQQSLDTIFGANTVFRDEHSVEHGADWPDTLRATLAGARALLVVIGPDWFVADTDPFNRSVRRIDRWDDWVRGEIEGAFAHSIPVYPVLVRGAVMPPKEALPPSIEKLASLQAKTFDLNKWAEGQHQLAAALAKELHLPRHGAVTASTTAPRHDPLLLGRGDEAPKPGKAWKWDLFLSFSAPQRDRARAVAQELRDRGRRVFLDERELPAGTAWVDALAEALRSARGLVALVDIVPSAWQRAEVEMFLSEVRQDGERFVIPVPLQERPAWPELFAFQALSGSQQSPAQIASAVHEAIQRRDAAAAGKSLVDEPRTVLRPRRWSAPEALAALREWLLQQHARLVPYFPGAAELLLEDVCVELDLQQLGERELVLGKHGLERGERRPDGHGRAHASLEHLLAAPREGGAAARLVVTGEPGAGKTTLARSLVLASAKARTRLVGFVPLARVDGRLDPFAFVVEDMLGERSAGGEAGRVLYTALQAEAAAGRLWFCFDGLDEVAPERIDEVLDGITRWAAAPEQRRVAIAVLARPIAFDHRQLPPTFVRANVLGLGDAQQKALLAKLLGAREAERLQGHVQDRPAFAELMRSPLLLTLLAVVARDTVLAEQPLPANRSQLYALAIDLLLRRGFGIDKKGVKDQQPARRVLQLLSFRLHDAGGEAWTRDALAKELSALRQQDTEANFLIKETWGGNDGFLDDIAHNAGVLGPHDGPQLPWRYLHRSLREYLAAEQVATWPGNRIQAHVAQWAQEELAEREARRGKGQPKATAGAEKPRPERWGEVFALLLGMRVVPPAVFDSMRVASADLLLRTLLQVDSIDGERGLRMAFATPGWDAGLLMRLVRQWMVPAELVERLVWEKVGADSDDDELGQYLWMLDQLQRRADRARFFAQAKRPFVPGARPKWIAVPGGSFVMGSPDSEAERDDAEGPLRRVELRPFLLSRTVVTNGEYWRFSPRRDMPLRQRLETDPTSHPAVSVSWWAAYAYCRWLGDEVRLPSEAEWEYACRAGTATPFSFGANITPEQVNYDGNYPYADGKKGEYRQRTVPVASLPANGWGLHEMHGNVLEWCEDWRADYSEAPSDGSAQQKDHGSGLRVLRGGSWFGFAWYCRSAYRFGWLPGGRDAFVGFRPASSPL